MRHLFFFFFLSGIFCRAREEFVNGYGTQWMGPLSKIKKRNERRKRRCGKVAGFPDIRSGPNLGQSDRFPLELVNVRDVGRGVITVGIVLSRASAQWKNVRRESPASVTQRERQSSATQKASPPHYSRSRLLRSDRSTELMNKAQNRRRSWNGVRSFAAAERSGNSQRASTNLVGAILAACVVRSSVRSPPRVSQTSSGREGRKKLGRRRRRSCLRKLL